jgi:hypothetical protein
VGSVSGRAAVREENRRLAAWCRGVGVVPSGDAWLAVKAGCRDVGELRVLNGEDGFVFRGVVPSSVPSGGAAGSVAGSGDAAAKPRVKRVAPLWIREASAAYRDARDAWEAARESCTVLAPTAVPGGAGASVCMAQLDDATVAEFVPAPVFKDFLRDAAAKVRAERAAAESFSVDR